jgi:hypothetical protein
MKMNKYHGGFLITEISIKWCDQDIYATAEEMGVEINKFQVSEVLQMLRRKHDATIGINWDVIKFWIDYILKDWEEENEQTNGNDQS